MRPTAHVNAARPGVGCDGGRVGSPSGAAAHAAAGIAPA
jgi:hypothetical protein